MTWPASKTRKPPFDVIELNDAYAYQLPMWAENANLVMEGEAAQMD
jgi:hypothetical protein